MKLTKYNKAIAGAVISSALIVVAHFAGETNASFVESAILPVVLTLGIAISPRNKP